MSFFVINCQFYAHFLLIFGQFYKENHHCKNVCQIKTKHRKIIFFVSNKSYDIGLSCNNTYFTTTITSYAVEGVAIVFFHPVQKFDSYEKMLKISNARPYYTYIPLYLRTDCDRVYVTNRDFF